MSIGEAESKRARVFFDSEPLIAWRTWRIKVPGQSDPVEATLYSTNWSIGWPAKEPFEASCRGVDRKLDPLKPHPYPSLECRCGIYGLKSKDGARKMWSGMIAAAAARSGYVGDAMLPCVVGQVALWGRIFRHEQGYRAQYAYPVNLSKSASRCDKELLREFGARYGVPLEQ